MNIATHADRPTSKFSWVLAEFTFQLVLVALVVGALVERVSVIA